MKIFTLLRVLTVSVLSFFVIDARSQTGVLDPDDPVVIYDPVNPPATPPNGTLAKWVKTTRVSFNTTSYKAYFYKGMAFRLKFPKSYKDSLGTGKKYPLFIFFHGVGNKGTIYDNENQLASGGSRFMGWVDNGQFDGFILCPQTSSASGAFNATHYSIINELIENYFIPQINVDPFRVIVNGLSGGGGSTWQMLMNYPKLVAAGLPISAVSNFDADPATIAQLKYTPIWLFQGGLDNAPAPFTARGVVSSYENAGANITYTEYPTLGHNCWNTAWAEPNFTTVINKAHKANPWPEFGRSEFCPNTTIQQVLGVTAGFDGYEWRKDGSLLSGANSNTYTATEKGVYDCRVKKGDTWSVWSPVPVVIGEKGVTLSPDIQFSVPASVYVPSPASPVSVQLEVPKGYTSYTWKKEGSDTTTLSTTRFLSVSAAGQYKVKVTEQFGCFSEYSSLFEIKNANAAGGPQPVSSLTASPLSKTALTLSWVKGSGGNAATGFEIFRADTGNGTYELAGVTDGAATGFTQTGLLANTAYYFKVRAINAQAASPASEAVTARTLADTIAPTAPTDLRVVGTTRSSVTLTWNEATDDVAVVKYVVYANGVKFQETDQNTFIAYNLNHTASYVFQVEAVDIAGNISPKSNQVTAQPLENGLRFKYYTTTQSWTKLPDFSTLTPAITGYMPNVTIANRTQDDFFGYLWEGFVTIPTTGVYYFRTSSDEGSRLWLGALGDTTSPYGYNAVPAVDNDGIHSSISVNSAPLTLQAGTYPIAIAYFDRQGGQSMATFWRTPASGTAYVAIPNSAFTDPARNNGAIPVAPSQFTATAVSYKQINLSWTDNSNNEKAFEVWRSTDAVDSFVMIASLSPGTTAYTDSASLKASTRYYYEVRAVGQFGESAFAPGKTDAQAFWRFNNNYDDASGNARALLPGNAPVFDSTVKAEPSHSLRLNGTNQYVDFVTATGDYLREAYSKKSITFWMKSNSNTGNRNVIDIGGRDHGLGIRLDANKIYAGVASSNIRYSVSANYANNDWHHIAMVYDTNTLRLYVDGVESGAVTNMTFTSIPAAAATSSIGRLNSSNAFNVGTAYFDGWIDELSVFGKALTATEVNAIRDRRYSSQYAETPALPAVPSAPASLTAQAQSAAVVKLTWTDTSTVVNYYELYRSVAGAEYALLRTVPAGTTSCSDSLLKANTLYAYRIRGVNEGGASAFSAADTAVTGNVIPVLAEVSNVSLRYDATLNAPVHATDSEGEALHFTVNGLPGFASFDSTANGTGVLHFAPQSVADTGNYTVTVTVADDFGGTASQVINVRVHTNYSPVITTVNPVTLDEKTITSFEIHATDANAGDLIHWTFAGLPSFATIDTGAGYPKITLAPGYADNGVYTVVAKAADDKGGIDSVGFVITVNDVDPSTNIWVSMTDGTYLAPAPWNNTSKSPTANMTVLGLKDDKGNTTSIGLNIPTAWFGPNNLGVNTGNNSGVYPDAVLRSSYVVSAARTLRVTGLDPARRYDFTFLGSRANPVAGVGVVANYTIGTQTVTLNSANNSTQTVSINGAQPAADSVIVITVANAAGSQYGYLNSLVIRSRYDDGSAPAAPRNLTASLHADSVVLQWTDAAYNETGYEVYRSNSAGGIFTLLNAPANVPDISRFADRTLAGGQTYYYTVRAKNAQGYSPFSDTVSVTVPNITPVMDPIADQTISPAQSADIAVNATDPGDTIELSTNTLPAFASFTDNGNGTGLIHVNAGAAQGVYPVTVTATDQHGASVSRQFTITVAVAPLLTKVYINFNQTTPVAAPWNNTNSAPSANLTLTDLKDENNASTGISMTLLDAWTATQTVGVVTGNNSGVYPDEVMRSFYYYGGADERRIRISGLSRTEKYDFTFFASRANFSSPLTTQYRIGSKIVELNATNNASQTVSINGQLADSNGELVIAVMKTGATQNAYLGAMVIGIHPYDSTAAPEPPLLTAQGVSYSQIKLDWAGTPNSSGYEIWRSVGDTTSYSLLTSVGTDVNTFTDNGLQGSKIYYYKARAIVNGTPTAFSNYAGASTVAYRIDLNLNDGSANAPAQTGNWNNTNTLITEGFELPDMINDVGQSTGISFELLKEFSGFNTFGATTGNNSGVYPDNVMKNFYYVSYPDTAKIRITGLVLSHQYNFAFFGSRVTPQVNVVAAYKIGNQVALLDAANNTSNTARITGVVPDADGSVTIAVTAASANGIAYLGAMSIEGVPGVPADPGITSGSTARGGQLLTAVTAPVSVIDMVSAKPDTATTGSGTEIKAYPNPFNGMLNLRLSLKENTPEVMIRVMDMNGRTLHLQKLSNALRGVNVYPLDLSSLQRGLYFIQVTAKGEKPVVEKVMKY